jgi:hypothetical protein
MMLLKTEERLWVTEIDAAISTFPQKVLSQLILSFLFFQDFAFDTTLIPCNTHGKKEHKAVDIKTYVTASAQQLVVTKYHHEWINVPLLPKLNIQTDNDLKLYLEVSGDKECTFRFTKNLKEYRSFIMDIGLQAITTHAFYHNILPGKSVVTIQLLDNADVLFITKLGNDFEIIDKEYHRYEKGTISQCDTILIGVGYFPQSVTILPCPPENDPIWNKIWARGGTTSCDCGKCRIQLIPHTWCIECEKGERGNIVVK